MAKLTRIYNLLVVHPDIAGQWHPTKNGKLTARDVTVSSAKKVWWQCNKGHEWQTAIYNRSRGKGCPYCQGVKVCSDNCLETVHPSVAMQWHPVKNGYLTPKDVTSYSNKKVWWKCSEGHEWEAKIYGRIINRSKCPYCSNRKVYEKNNLQTINPKLAKLWHTEKNRELSPGNITYRSRKKVWWKCKKGHEWQASIYNNVVLGCGCPYCSGKRASETNNLQVKNPKLASGWHPTKNGKLTPRDVTVSSAKKVWWQCSKGHEWQTAIYNRSRGKGCPYCTGVRVCSDNCLETINPSVAKQWHPFRNGILTPRDVTANSGKKVWWKCKNGHEWKAVIANRNNGTGCLKCIRSP